MTGRRPSLALLLALALWLTLSATTVRVPGLVGEVAAGWALGAPPRVAVALTPDGAVTWAGDDTWGPLRASRVRPRERLDLGGAGLPVAINDYTGGLADWPARIVTLVAGWTWGRGVPVALGALLVVLVHRFLRFHGTDVAAGLAALLLVTDVLFVTYRRLLGGTEVLLQAALLLVLWATWSRRWSHGRQGDVAIATGVGLGLQAKVTFVAPLVGLALALGLTRWDRPAMGPPAPLRWGRMGAIVAVLVAPLILAVAHQAAMDPPAVPSHDSLGLQWGRVVGGLARLGRAAVDREPLDTLVWVFLSPLAWWEAAFGAAPREQGPQALRLIGWGLVVAGTALEWRRRTRSPSAALLRLLSLATPAGLVLTWLANRDLHHLALLSPLLAAWAGLALDRLAALHTPPRSPARAGAALALALPLLVAGARDAVRLDEVAARALPPVVTSAGQEALVRLLGAHGVWRLVACDYELYGTLEVLAPEIEVTHAWGARAQGGDPDALLEGMLAAARGGHLLLVRPAAPLRYNYNPGDGQVRRAAARRGWSVELAGQLERDGETWARLYAVSP